MYSSLIPEQLGVSGLGMRLDHTFTWNTVSTYTHTHTHTHTQCPPRTIKRLIDKNLAFHKAIAWMIIVSSAIHVIAHWYNYERLVATPDLTSFLQRFPWEQRRIPNLAQPSLPAVQAVSQQCDIPELKSGCFSVGSCINRKRKFSDTNFEIRKLCQRFN